MTKEQRDEARAKAWANYIKVRDRERARDIAFGKKVNAEKVTEWVDRDELKAEVKREIEAKYKARLEAAEKAAEKARERRMSALQKSTDEMRDKIAAAWQAFEVLDVGGRTKR